MILCLKPRGTCLLIASFEYNSHMMFLPDHNLLYVLCIKPRETCLLIASFEYNLHFDVFAGITYIVSSV